MFERELRKVANETWSTLKANCVRPALWLCETWHFDSSPDLVSFTPMSQENDIR